MWVMHPEYILYPQAGFCQYQMNTAPQISRQISRTVVVLIEPDASVRDALELLLQSEGWLVHSLDGFDELALAIEDQDVLAVVSESSLPDCRPEEILEHCKNRGLPVIFTGHDIVLQDAVDLVRRGARDFLDKPFPQDGLVNLLNDLSAGQNS